MSQIYGRYGPAHPIFGEILFRATRWWMTPFYAARGFHTWSSHYARECAESMRQKLSRGEPVYLIGIGPRGHNSGVALVEVTRSNGVRLICNEEEERFSGIKHCTEFPTLSIQSLKQQLDILGIDPGDVHACLASWNYPEFIPEGARMFGEHFPFSLPLVLPSSSSMFNHVHAWLAGGAPTRLGRELGRQKRVPIIGMRHHDNHAYGAYVMSPFNRDSEPVMVTVLDGLGDDATISLYIGTAGRLSRVRSNHSFADSLGAFYAVVSSTQGGWTPLSSEGRYMGASAWGNHDRMTNPYYRRLRQIFCFENDGQVYVNRVMVGWHKWGERRPYASRLRAVLGNPIPSKHMWNPDAVLRLEETTYSEDLRERLDKAAATQLVFEDVLFHVVDYFIRLTGSDKLVMSGGTALNCVANMRLLDHFDRNYYQRYLGKNRHLNLWVPPTPGDAGVVIGAAFNFAMSNGAAPGKPLQHAFYCGTAPSGFEIRRAIETTPEINSVYLGNVSASETRDQVADFAAYVVAQDGVLGFFHGPAETGPRGLGHRSIVANPRNPNSLQTINMLVKFRERIRPLAPMATYEAAKRYFELADGAAADHHNAYNYMVLTVRARPEAKSDIPAVVHHDGTARIQLVREEIDPFVYAYLKAMGRRIGVEVSVNTSLNVQSPIVQSPTQALEVLKRAKGAMGLILIGAEGDAFLAWHHVATPVKDEGRQLRAWYSNWQAEKAAMTRVL